MLSDGLRPHESEAGRARRTQGHQKTRDQWTVLIYDHHPGYITWEQFELNQKILAENAHMKSRMGRQRGRGGPSVLVGIFGVAVAAECCGSITWVKVAKRCDTTASTDISIRAFHAASHLVAPHRSGRFRRDSKVIQPLAIDAAVQAAEQNSQQQRDHIRAVGTGTRAS